MDEEQTASMFLIIALIGVFMFAVGRGCGSRYKQDEAAKVGVGEYYIDTNSFKRSFRWKTNRE
jgi:hypothetical protein